MTPTEKEILDEARQVITKEKANPSYYSPVELIPASSIKPKPIQWLIPGLIPKGMTTMLAEIVIDATDTFALYQDILKKNGAVLPRVLCQHSNMMN